MNDFKQRWDANVELCKELCNKILPEEASEIVTMNESKSHFQNAMDYAVSEGLSFGDPARPKQTLARTLADEILKLHAKNLSIHRV
jgi:hypothetical protein